jgi:hypothetical protein
MERRRPREPYTAPVREKSWSRLGNKAEQLCEEGAHLPAEKAECHHGCESYECEDECILDHSLACFSPQRVLCPPYWDHDQHLRCPTPNLDALVESCRPSEAAK